jgi:GNAT superfamily N-acetyltransferase
VPDVDELVDVREATTADELDVRRVLDAAMLESTAVEDAVARGDAFVAVAGNDGAADEGLVVGALVLVPHASADPPDAVVARRDTVPGGGGMHVDAVAVRRRRRGQGVGRALVEAALDCERRLTVAFDPGVRAFYHALEFDVVTENDGRSWATRSLEEPVDG